MGDKHIPIIDEDKLDDIITALQALSAPSGTDVAISPTGMHIVTEDDVQGAISELDSAVDSVNASLTQLAKAYISSWTNGTYTTSGAKMSSDLVLPKGKYEVTIKTPVNSQQGSYLNVYNSTTNEVIDASYAPCNTYAISQFILNCAVETTIHIRLASNSSNTISYAERGGFYAKSIN